MRLVSRDRPTGYAPCTATAVHGACRSFTVPAMNPEVFITALGKFFPGDPIANDEMEDYLGRIHGRAARAKERVLAQNGIRTRHYALDKQQRTTHRNSEMAALAVRDLLARAELDGGVDYLGAATTQGD